MSFSDWLGTIQQKPYGQRVKIMWFCVIISMVIVFSVWMISLRNITGKNQNETASVKDGLPQTIEQYQQAKQEIPGLWQALKAAIWEAGQTEELAETVSEESAGIFKEESVGEKAGTAGLPKN